jgi:hypothetical protein
MIASITKARMAMSSLSKETLELIADWAEILTVALALGSAVCGIVLLMANRPLKRMAEQESLEEHRKTAEAQATAALANERASKLESDNLSLKTDLEHAKAESAKAQLQLRQYVDHKAGPRRLNREKFLEHLKGKPVGRVLILHKPEDMEAYGFANQIAACLTDAGWTVRGVTTFSTGGRGPRQSAIPAEVFHGGAFGSGVTIKCNDPRPTDDNTALNALSDALVTGRDGGGDLEIVCNPDLSDGMFEIVIGQRK